VPKFRRMKNTLGGGGAQLNGGAGKKKKTREEGQQPPKKGEGEEKEKRDRGRGGAVATHSPKIRGEKQGGGGETGEKGVNKHHGLVGK